MVYTKNKTQSKPFPIAPGALGCALTLSLEVASVSRFGAPLSTFTWLVFVLCGVSGLSLMLSGTKRLWFVVALAACTYLLSPIPFQLCPLFQVWALFDDVGGRSGVAFTPGLMLGRDGPNTSLMESYVGPLEPNWWYQAPLSPYIRDGDERAQSRSVIRHEYFSDVLAMLPNDEARRAVIEALTDPKNRLRVHQGLLLACFYVLKYLDDMTADSWWSHHQELFRSEYDPLVAASVVNGWVPRIEAINEVAHDPIIASQLRAAEYQQRGNWGGHADFGELFTEMEFGSREPDAHALAVGKRVVWWQVETQSK